VGEGSTYQRSRRQLINTKTACALAGRRSSLARGHSSAHAHVFLRACIRAVGTCALTRMNMSVRARGCSPICHSLSLSLRRGIIALSRARERERALSLIRLSLIRLSLSLSLSLSFSLILCLYLFHLYLISLSLTLCLSLSLSLCLSLMRY
jgi:hypothetical protein